MNPLIRINQECGTDTNISSGREPCQLGWYEWIGKKYCINKTVLDSGAGMCDGVKLLREIGSKEVWGQDIDIRLKHLDDNLIITSIDNIFSKSYDVVTCFDVIEHIIEDIEFFNKLIQIPKEVLAITTPNFSRSKAQNHCHCREYTIPQFVNCFSPDEIWGASPDGKVHHTLLLKKINDRYLDKTRSEIYYSVGNVPQNITFNHSTVDKNEWAHMCGIFYVKSI